MRPSVDIEHGPPAGDRGSKQYEIEIGFWQGWGGCCLGKKLVARACSCNTQVPVAGLGVMAPTGFDGYAVDCISFLILR